MKRGFSLVEIITVLFIVSLALVGILSLLIQNIQSQGYNKSNLIAYQLAQEGVELIRKVRDSNWRGANQPLILILPSGQYYMDYTNSAPHIHIPSLSSELILKQDTNGFYYHGAGGSSSGFSRLITLQTTPTFVQVTVRVTWLDRNRNYAYDLETILYNWK